MKNEKRARQGRPCGLAYGTLKAPRRRFEKGTLSKYLPEAEVKDEEGRRGLLGGVICHQIWTFWYVGPVLLRH